MSVYVDVMDRWMFCRCAREDARIGPPRSVGACVHVRSNMPYVHLVPIEWVTTGNV
jgi:hypothetical protein